MRHAQRLLALAREEFPLPGDMVMVEALPPQHFLTINDEGAIALTIHRATDPEAHLVVTFDDDDLDRSPEDLIRGIAEQIAAVDEETDSEDGEAPTT